VTVAYPWVLGDTYDELVESLSRLADAGLLLNIAAGAKIGQAKTSINSIGLCLSWRQAKARVGHGD
jgi:hypothetical protein